jgi:O-antigen/teichoic acid export membrane protein
VITARKAFITYNILQNLKAFITLAGVFFCVKVYGTESCIIWFVAASIITALLSFRIVRRYGITLLPFKTIRFDELKKTFSLSSWIAVSTAAVSVMYSMDTICLTWLKGLESVAMYQVALPIMQIAQSFFVFPAIFTPFVAEMWQKKDYSGIKRSCYLADFIMLLTLPVFILAGLYFAPDIIRILFNEKGIEAAPAVTILWCGMVFFSIASFNITALNSGGRQKNAAYIVLVCVFVNFVLNVILIPYFDYIGAALATATTYLIMAFASIIYTIFLKKGKYD